MGNSQKEDKRITLIQITIKILKSCVSHIHFANTLTPLFSWPTGHCNKCGLLVKEEITVAGIV